VLLLLVWSVLLGFVALLVVSIAQFAALLPNYAGEAEALIASVVNDLNDRGIVSGQLSDILLSPRSSVDTLLDHDGPRKECPR